MYKVTFNIEHLKLSYDDFKALFPHIKEEILKEEWKKANPKVKVKKEV